VGVTVDVAPYRNLRYARRPRIYMPNPKFLALLVFEITAFIQTDRRIDGHG